METKSCNCGMFPSGKEYRCKFHPKSSELNVRKDIKSLEYLKRNVIVECADGQNFYQNDKTFQIWNEEPLFLVKKISRKSIGFVHTF